MVMTNRSAVRVLTRRVIITLIYLVVTSVNADEKNQSQVKGSNTHNHNAIDRVWGMPSDSKAHLMSAPETKSLEEVIDLIKAVESAYPDDDWKVTAARLRKTHYNSKLWDLLLIGSIDIEPASVDKGVSPSVISILKKGNIVFKDPHGNAIDVTHVWALINALSYPSIDTGIDDLSGISVADSISWVGDIGSVLSEYGLKTRPHFDSLQQYFHGYSSGSDLYGDVDGYGVFHQSIDGGMSLSQRVEFYYQGNFKNRFDYYEKATDIKFEESKNEYTVSNLSVENVIEPHVRKFAYFWTLHLCRANELECVLDDVEKRFYTTKDIDTVVSLYSQWMTTQLTDASRY
ncbi:hypothetical protein [Enterovibrio calviensis]|uniref:hypothetical protein n=1 Tax=Enterovibrio calviensis TaxID=91359 RepID=UPI0037350E0C